MAFLFVRVPTATGIARPPIVLIVTQVRLTVAYCRCFQPTAPQVLLLHAVCMSITDWWKADLSALVISLSILAILKVGAEEDSGGRDPLAELLRRLEEWCRESLQIESS